MRIGMGYDIHRLVTGRRLILGGVEIPYDKGLLGHSDADVLTHAVCDALLGAAGLGDIGNHFPDTEAAWAGIDSLLLLSRVREMIAAEWTIANLDITVLAQAPKISPFAHLMCRNLAKVLGIDPLQINIKATTTEGLGDIGRGAAVAAQCVVLLESHLSLPKFH
jgi:2-C-methyl-D-erythritol 2,4-cyclodiphosphate synthase